MKHSREFVLTTSLKDPQSDRNERQTPLDLGFI